MIKAGTDPGNADLIFCWIYDHALYVIPDQPGRVDKCAEV